MIRYHIYKISIILLLLTTCAISAWGQTDYSGTYYIGSNGYDGNPNNTDNYYLCPTEGWAFFVSDDTNPGTVQGDDNGKPFLTTYQFKKKSKYDATKALWTIEKESNSNHYYIRQVKTGKYIVSNGAMSGNPDRARVHLEPIANPNDLDDKALFDIYLYNSNHLVIKSISIDETQSDVPSSSTHFGTHDDHKWLTVNQGNKDNLAGTNAKTDGPISFPNTGGIICIFTEADARADFYLEEIVPRPVISYNSNNNQIEITHSGENATFYYTTDGSNPTTTNYASTGSEITNITSSVTIKAIAAISQEGCTLPIISPVAEIRVVPNPTISLASSSIVYNGSEQTPAFSVWDGETEIPSSEYTVSYSNNTNAGNIATVTITDNAGGNYIVYGSTTFTINPKPLTITAQNKNITYGDIPANDGVTYGEFASGEDENDLTGTLTYTYNYEQYGDAGSYTITPSGLSNSNYDITFVPGTLTVNKKPLTITAKPKTITYGDVPTNDGVTYGEFVGEETESVLTGTLGYDYSYTQYGDVGNAYTITPKGLASTNYAISFVAGTLTVNQREVGIEWGNTSLGYNGSAQAPTATATNVVNNDEVTVTVTGAQTDVGTGYTATATGLTGAKAGNYVLSSSNTTTTFSIGTGTFTPTVSIDGWTYGDASNAPSVSGNVSGGDVVYSYSVKGENNYSATVPTHAGNYTVKVTIAAKGNYNSAEATKDFTISPKSIGDGNKTATGITIEMNSDGELSAVKDGEITLEEDTDYTQQTTENDQDKLVTVTGIGNYKDSAKGIYAKPVFTDPDGNSGSEQAAAVYQATRDMAKPTGIKPYIVRKVNPSIGTMTISPLEYIPEGVPVLLLSDAEAEGFVASPKDEETPEITDGTKNSNQLKVSQGGETVDAAQIYVFYRGEFVLTKAGTLSADKFYLYNPNFSANPEAQNSTPSQSIRRFVIEEEPTGINDVRSKMADVRDDWHTLDGRKLNGKPTKAGLYIKNGRKTIIKRK